MALQLHAVVRVHGNLPGNALHLADHAPILHGLFLNFIGRRDLEFVLEGLFLLHGLYAAEFRLQSAFGFGRIFVIGSLVAVIRGAFRSRRDRKLGPVVGPRFFGTFQFRR